MTRLPKNIRRILWLVAIACVLLLGSSRLHGLLANSALLAFGTIAISLPLGVILGVIIAKIDIRGRRAVGSLMVALLFIPLYVQAAAWNAVLGAGGWLPQALANDGDYADPWLAGWRGAIWVHAMAAVPWAALMTAASLLTVERRLEEESLLDAPPWRVLRRVSLRRALGGIFASAVWIAVICATEIAATDLYQVRTFAEEIYTQASLGSLSAEAGALMSTDLVAGVAMIAMLVAIALSLVAPYIPKAASISPEAIWKWRPTTARCLAPAAVVLLLSLVILVPLAGLLWKAGIAVSQRGSQFERSWSAAKVAAMIGHSPWEHRREWGWSAMAGAMAAVAATVPAVFLVWWARMRPGVAMPLAAIMSLSFAVPAPLLGVWVIALLNHPPESVFAPITALYDRTLLAPVAVQTVRALPIVGLWIWFQFVTVPRDLLEAARSEGAGPLAQLFRIAVPLRRPGIFTALGIAFVLAIGELSATLLVVPPGVTPISVRLFQLLHYGVDDRVAALALSVLVVTALAMAAWRCARGSRL
jgi:iron(III) transport system permease protein